MAVQLCALPWLGFVPDDVAAVPAAAANRVAVQLGVPIADLAGTVHVSRPAPSICT
jgi:hypothetical protein